jgi:hypothetical protein
LDIQKTARKKNFKLHKKLNDFLVHPSIQGNKGTSKEKQWLIIEMI